LLFLSSGFDDQRRWTTALPLFGGAAMLGLPLTIGLVGANGVYGGAFESNNWPVLIVVVLAQCVLAAGLWRVAGWPGQPLEGNAFELISYWIGLGLLALGLVVFGAASGWLARALNAPGLGAFGFTGNLAPLVGVLMTIGLGSALWRYADVLRARAETVWEGAVALLRLDWLYRAAWAVFRLVGVVVFNVAGVLEGEGAILWTLVAAVLLWLLFRSL
jgi:hypothetical protein